MMCSGHINRNVVCEGQAEIAWRRYNRTIEILLLSRRLGEYTAINIIIWAARVRKQGKVS
jgi:hypothetical protein